MDWVKSHAHVILAVVSATGIVAGTIAANTAHLLPPTVTAVLVAAAAIIANSIAAIAGTTIVVGMKNK